jgi:hypothetical protein
MQERSCRAAVVKMVTRLATQTQGQGPAPRQTWRVEGPQVVRSKALEAVLTEPTRHAPGVAVPDRVRPAPRRPIQGPEVESVTQPATYQASAMAGPRSVMAATTAVRASLTKGCTVLPVRSSFPCRFGVCVALLVLLGCTFRDDKKSDLPTHSRPTKSSVVGIPSRSMGGGSRLARLGESCAAHGATDCASNICVHQAGGGPDKGYICSQGCSTSSECSVGWRCARPSPASRSAICLPPPYHTGTER